MLSFVYFLRSIIRDFWFLALLVAAVGMMLSAGRRREASLWVVTTGMAALLASMVCNKVASALVYEMPRAAFFEVSDSGAPPIASLFWRIAALLSLISPWVLALGWLLFVFKKPPSTQPPPLPDGDMAG